MAADALRAAEWFPWRSGGITYTVANLPTARGKPRTIRILAAPVDRLDEVRRTLGL